MTIPMEQLLNLPDIRVLRVELNERDIQCEIESSRGYASCHQGGQPATQFFAYGEVLQLRQLPICEREVTLDLQTRRYRCQGCAGRTTTTERGDWSDAEAGCTKAFAQFLLRALINSTLQDVTTTHQVSYGCVRGLLTRSVKDAVDSEQFSEIAILGMDEISLRTGHRDFVTLISTRDTQGRGVILAV